MKHFQAEGSQQSKETGYFVQFIFILSMNNNTPLCVQYTSQQPNEMANHTIAGTMMVPETMSMLYNIPEFLHLHNDSVKQIYQTIKYGYNNYDHAGHRITKLIHKKTLVEWCFMLALSFLPKTRKRNKRLSKSFRRGLV